MKTFSEWLANNNPDLAGELYQEGLGHRILAPVLAAGLALGGVGCKGGKCKVPQQPEQPTFQQMKIAPGTDFRTMPPQLQDALRQRAQGLSPEDQERLEKHMGGGIVGKAAAEDPDNLNIVRRVIFRGGDPNNFDHINRLAEFGSGRVVDDGVELYDQHNRRLDPSTLSRDQIKAAYIRWAALHFGSLGAEEELWAQQHGIRVPRR